MKKKRIITMILLGIAMIPLSSFLYLSRHIEGRYQVGVKLGLVAADTSLHKAAGLGQKNTVEHLVVVGYDVNAKDRWGQTPLFVAARGGSSEVAKFLITKGAHVNVKCKSWWMHGKWWKRRAWLERSLDWSPLHAAAEGEHRGIVDLLLNNGADVSAQNNDGDKPLHLATDVQVAGLLVGKGANVNAKNNNGETPLHKMIGRKDVAELLIAKGADVNAKDKDGMAVLDYAVMTDLVESLVAKGADHTIHSAAYMGESSELRALTEKGADVNARDKFGMTALHMAAFTGHKRLVKLLLANGARIDDMGGKIRLTPLHMAALTGHFDVAELLISNGADINTKSGLDWTPLLLAINNGHKQLIEFLLNNGANVNLMTSRLPESWSFYLSHEDNGRGVWLLLIRGMPTSGTSVGPIPRALAEQLIFKGPETEYKWPISPLWVAKHTENSEIVTLLKEYGALELSLHQAAAEGNIEQVRFHISRGTDLNGEHRGRTPLRCAGDNGHTEIVDLLRKHGAKE